MTIRPLKYLRGKVKCLHCDDSDVRIEENNDVNVGVDQETMSFYVWCNSCEKSFWVEYKVTFKPLKVFEY